MRRQLFLRDRHGRRAYSLPLSFVLLLICVILSTCVCGVSLHSDATPSATAAAEVRHNSHRHPVPTASPAHAENASSPVGNTPIPLDESHTHLSDDEFDSCPTVSFHFLVSSAMGVASTTSALATCGAARYSTILDDMHRARRLRESSETFTSALWKLLRGTPNEIVLFDNAGEFLSMQAEMASWIRANRTVGMNPSAYEAVLRGAGAVLSLNRSLLDVPAVELPPRAAGGAPVNWTQLLRECHNTSGCLQRVAQEAYRQHANATLASRGAQLLVSNATFTRAQHYHEQVVFPSIIVRAFDLDPATTKRGFDRNLHDFLRAIQQLWEKEVRGAEAERVTRAGAAVIAPPYLPFVRETDLTGPRRAETSHLLPDEVELPQPSRQSGMRMRALHRILPSAVVYHTSAACTTCAVYDRAFEILPAVYKRMCSRGYRSIISCSPVTLFLRTTHLRAFQLLPSLELYARLAYSRAAVLRVAELNARFPLRSARDGENEAERKARQRQRELAASMWDSDVDDESTDEMREGEESEEEDDGDDDDGPVAAVNDEITSGSRFYSLEEKYSRWSAGIEDEVRPRTQFLPRRIPLRLQSEASTVEEAVVHIIADLVDSGVIQFFFLDPDEVSQIARENERLRRMLEKEKEEEEERAEQQRQREAAAKAINNTSDADNTSTLTAAAAEGAATTKKKNAAATKPENHPQYRKVMSFHDLATKLVAAHTRAVFGDLSHVRSTRGALDSGRMSHGGGNGVASFSSSSSWLLQALNFVWGLLFSGIERPLYFTFFVLLCLFQRWWNRLRQVSYW